MKSGESEHGSRALESVPLDFLVLRGPRTTTECSTLVEVGLSDWWFSLLSEWMTQQGVLNAQPDIAQPRRFSRKVQHTHNSQ